MKAAFDLTGQVFGYLSVLRRAPSAKRMNGGAQTMWVCRCECGKEIIAKGQKLRAGVKKSCSLDGHVFRIKTDAASLRPEYRSWEGMWRRCTDENANKYAIYGGRGILVCDRWKDFKLFINDLGCRPTLAHTIDRIDTNGNYEPGNCRWATRKEQARNMRHNVYVQHEGERILLVELVENLGLNRAAIFGRMRMGWPLAKALVLPIRPRKKNRKKGADLISNPIA